MDKITVVVTIAGLEPIEKNQYPSTAEFAAMGFEVALRKRLLQKYEAVDVTVRSVANDEDEHVTIQLDPSMTDGMTTQQYEEHRYFVEDAVLEVYDEHKFWKLGVVAEINDALEFGRVESSIGKFQHIDAFVGKLVRIAKHADNEELVRALEQVKQALDGLNAVLNKED